MMREPLTEKLLGAPGVFDEGVAIATRSPNFTVAGREPLPLLLPASIVQLNVVFAALSWPRPARHAA